MATILKAYSSWTIILSEPNSETALETIATHQQEKHSRFAREQARTGRDGARAGRMQFTTPCAELHFRSMV